MADQTEKQSELALTRQDASRAPLPSQAPSGRVHPEVRELQIQDIFKVVVALRLINALFLRTFFQPDEYFQALEPAWRLAFGPNSGAWLTWEWEHQLRSSLHPVLFGTFYRSAQGLMTAVSYFPQFQALVLPVLPRLLQSGFAALGDYYTWRLAERMYGDDSTASSAALWMTVLNPWQWYCSTRTFSSSLETSLTTMALYHWPWQLFSDAEKTKDEVLKTSKEVNSLRMSLLLAAVAVVLRPTNLLIWAGIATLTLSRLTLDGKSPVTRQTLLVLIREAVLCGALALAVSAVSDFYFYGEWTFPAYKFLDYNLSQSLAVFYGESPWHYYLLQGIPLLTTTFLPAALIGLLRPLSSSQHAGSVQQSNSLKTLAFCVLTMVTSLSLISHKEVRFIYPLLPILHVLAAPYLAAFFTAPSPATPGTYQAPGSIEVIRKPFLVFLVLCNVMLAGYLSLFHQAAPMAVTSFLHQEYERLHPDRLGVTGQTPPIVRDNTDHTRTTIVTDNELFALFLTPCHSTPWRSHLVHAGLRARALTCEPPLHTQPGSAERRDYLDEADRFYLGRDTDAAWGEGFLAREMWPVERSRKHVKLAAGAEDLPRYIVGFEGIEPVLTRFFGAGTGMGLGVTPTRVWEGWNGFFNEDSRRQGKLVVWDTGLYSSETPEENLVYEEL